MAGPEDQSKRPSDSKFKQQKLPAWKPILTPRTVLPTFVAIGILFIALGAACLVASNSVKEVEIEYTDCKQTKARQSGSSCGEITEEVDNGFTTDKTIINEFAAQNEAPCTCNVQFELDQDFDDSETFLYYGLTNYFQNHRRYVKSRSDPQLRSVSNKAGGDCSPLNTVDDTDIYYAPCGLIANSLFNDTFQLFRCTGDDPATCTIPISMTGKGIAWSSDVDTKFQNPQFTGSDPCTAEAFSPARAASPPNWNVRQCLVGQSQAASGGDYNPWSSDLGSSGVAYENEDLIVWMRTAALPSFRKLHRKVETDKTPLTNGKYMMKIGYNYPVTKFDGTKKFVITTTSWLGGENPFLGICYLVVGCLSLAVAVFFYIFQQQKGRKLGDDRFLKWDQN